MQKRQARGYAFGTLFGVLLTVATLVSGQAFAQTSTSPNYQMTETQFGNTSGEETCSSQYCASVSIGDDGASSSASSAELGKANYSEPTLEVSVESGPSDLGELTTERTGTKVMYVKIRNYLSEGYRMQVIGDAPKYDNHTLATPTTPTDSTPGTEQFGINVVANSNPTLGADPVSQPSGQTNTLLATANYRVSNKFMYIPGQTVAENAVSDGGADYTITMIVNISTGTPAGQYSSDFSAVVIPFF